MRKTFATALILLCSLAANALPLVWRADWPDAKPVETLVHRGTDIELQPTWFINKAAADTNGWSFTTFCQTNAVGPWFGPLPGAFFSHTNDVGAAFYNVMVRAQMPSGAVNYTAFARLRMLDSPGFTPGELPLPVATIDFSKVVALNAPWLLPDATNATAAASRAYTDSATNRLLSSACSYTDASTNALGTAINNNLETNYYTAAETDDAIDSLAAYYITYTAAGAAFPTCAALTNATVVYSGGAVRTPTRNDYCVVLDDETHGGAEWRYIYAVADGATTGQWEAQYPIESNDYEALSNKPSINGNELFGNKTAAQLGLATPDDVAAALDAATNYTDSALSTSISASNADFSNAVLSVGLNIDTNAVAAINALVEQGEELPTGGATSVGALLLALAAAIAALKKQLPYALVEKTIENGAVTLDDRASNAVEISATLSPNTLTVNFPTATSGKVRDFALRLNIASGVTAPELVLPQGVVCENADGEVPEISDGGTGGSSTILYFSETENNGTTAKFLLKGETLAAITQA